MRNPDVRGLVSTDGDSCLAARLVRPRRAVRTRPAPTTSATNGARYPRAGSTRPDSSSPAIHRRICRVNRPCISASAAAPKFARCGVISARGSVHSGWPSGSGSGSVTSRAAPAIEPAASAATSASVSTSTPRATFTSQASSDIASSSSAPMRPAVSGVDGAASTTTSASGSTERSSPTGTTRAKPSTGRPDRLTPTNVMPHGPSSRATPLPIDPVPTTTIVAPNSGWPPLSTSQDVARAAAWIRRRPGEHERDDVLGHRVAVGLRRARPHALVVDDPGGHPLLDARPRQLHPAHAVVQQRLQLGRIVVEPDDRLGLRGIGHGLGAARADGLEDRVVHPRADEHTQRHAAGSYSGWRITGRFAAPASSRRRTGVVYGRVARDLRVLGRLAQDLGDARRRTRRASRASRSRSAR